VELLFPKAVRCVSVAKENGLNFKSPEGISLRAFLQNAGISSFTIPAYGIRLSKGDLPVPLLIAG
jgi:hypothetical protein